MSHRGFAFRRIVLDLHASLPDAEAVSLVADLAALMRLDLLGRFVEDLALARLAGLPFAREFRLPEREWHALDSSSTMQATEAAVARARRLFSRAAASFPSMPQFEVVRGGNAPTGGQGGRRGDIVVIPHAIRSGEPLLARLEAALREAAGALVLPRRPARRRGAIVAIASGEDDPSIRIAAEIAASAHETLLRIDRQSFVHPRGEPAVADAEIAGSRLLVLSRSALADRSLPVAAISRQVPVLVVETEDVGGPEGEAG